MMVPSGFIERIKTQSYIDVVSLAEALSGPAVTSVRVNRGKWPHPVSKYEQVEWEPDGYYLPGRPLFTADPLFHAGVYYPQESSSMFAGEVFRQLTAGVSGLRVLDLCGAPGGKSTHLAGLIGDNGLLVANEAIRARAAVLAENVTKWGTGNVVVTNADPSRFALLPGFFDVIVADAPCSGEGMFRTPAAVREWSVQNTRLCSERQRRIVMEAWPSLKPGGILIYSTCTFNPAENEENAAWLSSVTGAVSLPLVLPVGSNIIPIRFSAIEGYGFHPGRVRGEGFFIAALRKPVGSGREQGPGKSRKAVLKPSPEAFALACSLVEFETGRVVMQDGRITALAAEASLYSFIVERLPVIKSGTMIGEVKKNDFVPAHDLAMSVRLREAAWPVHPLSRNEALAYLRLEPPDGSTMPAGRVLLTYRGVPLGFVNNLGTRVNNGYPQGWRIRMELTKDFDDIF
ncbi:MAG: RsmF rRNA methyltransferase first C-terminal domain-containing protein [Actinomycetota bacterium]